MSDGPLFAALRKELARLGPPPSLAPLVEAWPEAVGTAIAANAWPARTARDGTLVVHASSSAWAFELTQLEGMIAERLRGALGPGAPPRIRFAVGPLPEGGAERVESPARFVPRVRDEDRAEASRIASPIEDPELRALVARAAAASLAAASAADPDRPV